MPDDHVVALGEDADSGITRRSWHLQTLAMRWEALSDAQLENATILESRNGVSWAAVVEYFGPNFADMSAAEAFAPAPPQTEDADADSRDVQIQLNVHVMGASGLQGTKGLYCLGRFRGKPESEWTTHPAEDFVNPVWDHTAIMPNFAKSDALELSIRSADGTTVGWTVLPGASIYPQGYKGNLDLRQDGAQQSVGVLRVALEFQEIVTVKGEEDVPLETDMSDTCSDDEKGMQAEAPDDFSVARASPEHDSIALALIPTEAELKPINMLEEAIASMRKLGVKGDKLAAAEARLENARDALHKRKEREALELQNRIAPVVREGDEVQGSLMSLRLAVGCNSDGLVGKRWPPPEATVEIVREAIESCRSCNIEPSVLLSELESLFDSCSAAWCAERGNVTEAVGSDILSELEGAMVTLREKVKPALEHDQQ